MVCSFHCASRTHYSSARKLREVRLSGRCVRWLSLPSTSTQIDTGGTGKFHVCTWDRRSVCVVCQPAAREARRTTKSDGRSEEHTSELQSLRHLVCRLL